MGDLERPSPSSAAGPALAQPMGKKRARHGKALRAIRNAFRSFPIISPTACKFPSVPDTATKIIAGSRVTGTMFGYRRGRVSLSIQENPHTLPSAVVELAMQTQALQKELSQGMVRIALECEKRTDKEVRTELMEEPLWTMYSNGKKVGYAAHREATEEDLHVMEVLKAVSTGVGVFPDEGPDGELAYIRAHFDRVVGSKDSETLYMVSPDGSIGPELSIFFVRL